MSDSTETVRTLVERLRAAFGTEPPVQLAVLFGSAAGGIRRPDSDIDVAILPVPPGLEPIEEAALCHRLARAGRADVDLIRLDTSLSTLLRWQIATTGVPLVERVPGAFARFRAEAASEYIGFAPALAYRIPRGDLQAAAHGARAHPMTNRALVLAASGERALRSSSAFPR